LFYEGGAERHLKILPGNKDAGSIRPTPPVRKGGQQIATGLPPPGPRAPRETARRPPSNDY
jgi:hypothetical protein